MINLSKSRYGYDLFATVGVVFFGIALFLLKVPTLFVFLLPLVGIFLSFVLGLETSKPESPLTPEVIKFVIFVIGLISEAFVLNSVFGLAGVLVPVAIFFFFVGLAIKG